MNVERVRDVRVTTPGVDLPREAIVTHGKRFLTALRYGILTWVGGVLTLPFVMLVREVVTNLMR